MGPLMVSPSSVSLDQSQVAWVQAAFSGVAFWRARGRNPHPGFLSSFFFLFFLPVLIPKEKPPITVVGDVGGRIAIIVVGGRDGLEACKAQSLPVQTQKRVCGESPL